MVIQFQPVLGFGSRLSHPNKIGNNTGINLQGHSFTSRFLIGVMPKQMYRDSLDVFDTFMVEAMRSLESLYYEGLPLQDGRLLRFLVVGLKGDLPFLAKAGHLNRTFLNIRKAPEKATSKPLAGCCWMCGAGALRTYRSKIFVLSHVGLVRAVLAMPFHGPLLLPGLITSLHNCTRIAADSSSWTCFIFIIWVWEETS